MNTEQIFINTINQKILKFLAGNPEKVYFDSEIAKIIRISTGACNQALRDLYGNDLVIKEKKGRMNFYQINSESGVIRQYKVLLTVLGINDLIEKIKNNSLKIILFGSASRGENLSDSDLDLFILSRQKEEIEKIIKKIENQKIKLIIKTPTEFASLEKNDSAFFEEIRKGLVIWEDKS